LQFVHEKKHKQNVVQKLNSTSPVLWSETIIFGCSYTGGSFWQDFLF